jgi:hypothetical protein
MWRATRNYEKRNARPILEVRVLVPRLPFQRQAMRNYGKKINKNAHLILQFGVSPEIIVSKADEQRWKI